jgi:hypothetical protein
MSTGYRLILCAMLAFGCSAAAPRPEAAADKAAPTHSDCPATAELQLASCRQGRVPGYGTEPARPLQWGVTAAGGLYFGRLVCPQGALATAHRRVRGGAIDTWDVRCPGEDAAHVWYTAPAQCGDPCPPDGFHVIPDAALQAYMASVQAHQADDIPRAVAKAREANRLAPPNELMAAWFGAMLVQSGNSLEAIPIFEAVVRMNPDEPEPKLYLAMAQRAAGHAEPYHAAVAALLTKLAPNHPLVAELQCLRAEHLHEVGQPTDSSALATQSCQAGFQGCCKH